LSDTTVTHCTRTMALTVTCCCSQCTSSNGTWGLQAECRQRLLTLYRALHSGFTNHLLSQPRKN